METCPERVEWSRLLCQPNREMLIPLRLIVPFGYCVKILDEKAVVRALGSD